jgi:formylglycine-generating enzyme required for sulfatase activity
LDNADNRFWPVGVRKPNDFGLFDPLGNSWDWCQDKVGFYKSQPEDCREDLNVITNEFYRVARGASSFHLPGLLRSARRERLRPNENVLTVSFRIVRTVVP